MIDLINTIKDIIKLVIAILPFILLCFKSRKINLNKSERSKQFFMPIIAIIYSFFMMYCVDWICDWLIKLINNIPRWIESWSYFLWMPEVVGKVLVLISKLIDYILSLFNLNYWICFLANMAIILVYFTVKKISLALIDEFVKTDGNLHTIIAGNFYEFFAERNKWCIKENFVQTRSLLKTFYYGAVFLSSALMLISNKLFYDGLLASVFYPVFGIIIVGELYFYLDDSSRREYSSILGEDEDAYKVTNYSLLRKFLRSIFGDKLLAENTSINNALSYDVTTDEIIREIEKSEDPKEVSFATYMKMLHKTGFEIDHNYLYSSLDLLNGKSILFNNPFYNDLIPYAFYPMNRTLLSHQKVLVVLGRHAIEDDIRVWIERGIESITNIPFMWNIGVLNSEEQDIDIGIITRSDVLDIKLHEANAEFLEKVGYVVVIEPSKLISTAQIGLNLIVKKCKSTEDKNIVYCLCDKNCDGLVDAMSHILMTSLTEVSATKKHLGTSSYMCWEADEEYVHHRLVPNISRYLGLGTELSFAALKNQVSKTKWYGGEAFPVTDIRWIDKQYYYDLTKYAGLTTSEKTMDEHFITSSNFWSAEVERDSYLTVEDESFNMFEILRDFSTRTTSQGFINVISSEYMLKDYMADNASIFEADAKAIPYIVADYTRSNRNTILRLILRMSTSPITVPVIEKELSLLGIRVFDLKKQLWYELYKCYAKIEDIKALPEDYETAVGEVANRTIEQKGYEVSIKIIQVEENFNLKIGRMETTYSIEDPIFLAHFVSELKSAGYVAEDEKGEKNYLGSELSGHIYQKYMPGQFFTFDGKYYEMQYLTADGQVLVRRAADHINGRPSYRQIREYVFKGIKASDKIGAQKNISGLKVIREFADIVVNTSGYYNMERYNDFTTAQKVEFEGNEKNSIPSREYCNKEILRIELPNVNDSVRYTITVLFNEVFKTLFAENQAYICAITDDSHITDETEIKPLTYSMKAEGCETENNCIYIIEDSQLDLGLIVAVERNLQRIFQIVNDYLDWHMETLEISLTPPPEPEPEPDPVPPSDETEETEGEEKKKKGIKGFFGGIGRAIRKLIEKIKGWFKRKPKKGEEPEEKPEEEEKDPTDIPEENPENPEDEEKKPEDENGDSEVDDSEGDSTEDDTTEDGEKPTDEESEGDEQTPEETPQDETGEDAESEEKPEEDPKDDKSGKKDDEDDKRNMADEVEISSSDDIEETPKPEFSFERLPYHERYYLLYGHENELSCLDIVGTLDYLTEMGFDYNPLKQARDNKDVAKFIAATFKPGKPNSRYCDFCGTEIYGVEYETLADGRDRCVNCSRTAIKTEEEFKKIFADVKRNMEAFFGIRINIGIKVEMVNSATLHKRLGQAFIPTPKSDGRVLGVAIKDKNGYRLMVENGSPRMASMLTMAHELTHIWQYINWDDKAIRKKYGKEMRLEIYEGMAKWVEVQYAYLINEPAVAKREEIITAYRDDEYGRGFLRYRANYPFSLGTYITKPTPFMNLETPLDLEFCGPITVNMPTPGEFEVEDDSNGGKVPTGKGGRKPKKDKKEKEKESLKGPKERDPENVRKYAYELLSDGEKVVYDKIYNAIKEFAKEVIDLGGQINFEQCQKVVRYVNIDHPELFWYEIGSNTTYYYDQNGPDKIVNKITIGYKMTKEEANSRQEEINQAIKPFLNSITENMSDYEVTLRAYENIINLVDYDTIGLEKQDQIPRDEWGPDDLRSIYGVFVNKKAVCAGYAKATQYLLNKLGIECIYVVSDTHAWNMVKLEGDYYHLDTTWGDGTNTKAEKNSFEKLNYNCFCITTEDVLRLVDHTPVADFPIPECTARKCNYYYRNGLFFETYSFAKIRDIVKEKVEDGDYTISFKYANEKVYEEARKSLVDEHKFREIIQYLNMDSKTRVNTAFQYTTQDDKFILSFYLKKF